MKNMSSSTDLSVQKHCLLDHPPFQFCHAATVDICDETLLVAFLGGNYKNREQTSIWLITGNHNRQTPPRRVASGNLNKKTTQPCWNPVLYCENEKSTFLYYKVGPSPENWQGYFIHSTDAGTTWSSPTLIPEHISGPTRNKPVAVNNTTLLIPGSTESRESWQINFNILHEKTIIEVPNPSRYQCIQPCLLRHSDTAFSALCRTRHGFIARTASNDSGKTWAALTLTHLPNPNSAIDCLSRDNLGHFLVYNNDPQKRTHLDLAFSQDGKQWASLLTLEDGEGEFSYPSLAMSKDGTMHIVYTWNRKNIRHVILTAAALKDQIAACGINSPSINTP